MTDSVPPGPDPEYDLVQVAAACRRSVRWVSDRIKRDQIEHTRHGNKITFTPAQFKAFQDRDRFVPAAQPVTTGPSKVRS